VHLFAVYMTQALTPIRFKATWVSTTQSYDSSSTHFKRQSGTCDFRFSHFLQPCRPSSYKPTPQQMTGIAQSAFAPITATWTSTPTW
jgi:hypothetical protein